MDKTVKKTVSIKRRGVPTIILVWLGITVFWLGVSAINRLYPAWMAASSSTGSTALTSFYNDETHVIGVDQAARLARVLETFEKETSNQMVVAVYPRLLHGAIEQFTIEIAEHSRLGRKGIDNGAILFLFMEERVARLEIGYGLEGAITDADAHRILESQLAPAFAAGNYIDGLDRTLAATFKSINEGFQPGKTPTRLSVFLLQLKVGVPKLYKQAWPSLVGLDVGKRVVITLFAGLLGMGVWDGFRQSARLLRNLVRGAANIKAGRALLADIEGTGIESIWDTLKLLALLLVVVVAAAGLVVVAAGGSFGGAGAKIYW
jgi:uncharacterized membrane protein YgcG